MSGPTTEGWVKRKPSGRIDYRRYERPRPRPIFHTGVTDDRGWRQLSDGTMTWWVKQLPQGVKTQDPRLGVGRIFTPSYALRQDPKLVKKHSLWRFHGHPHSADAG